MIFTTKPRFKPYERTDIITVPITPQMYNLAVEDSKFFQRNYGGKTRYAYEERDIVGSLAHQIVELKLSELGVSFQGFRATKYQSGGDVCDVIYERDYIDVKGTHGEINEKYFYNERFLVFEDQLNDPKFDVISHLCFVKIKPDYTEGYIYGVINKDRFLELCTPVELKYKNQAICSRHLKPFNNYVFRTN